MAKTKKKKKTRARPRPKAKPKPKRRTRKAKSKPKPVPKKLQLKKFKVPVALQKRMVKKFRVRQYLTQLVLVLSQEGVGYQVAVITKRHLTPTVLRTFENKVPADGSAIPESFWKSYAYMVAVWYARHLASHGLIPPSQRKERSKRKGVMKKLVRSHQEHMATKHIMRVVAGVTPPVVLGPRQRMPRSTFVCVYDPKSRSNRPKQPTTFMLHSPACIALDARRRTAQKHNGDSWVLEGEGVEAAVADQLAEFDADQMGYDRSDFSIHNCVSTRVSI